MPHPFTAGHGLPVRPHTPACWRPQAGPRAIAFPPPSRVPTATGRGSGARLSRVEAALWFADGPLALRRLARAAGLSGPAEARELIEELRRRHAACRGALEVVEVAGGYRLVTRAALASWIDRFSSTAAQAAGPAKMSGSAAETLAVVAYRQPATRSEVEAIRGVGCGEMLRQLLDADLLRIVGRCEELGRPLLYGTTDRFLELYGLGSLADLPDLDEGAGVAEPSKQNAPAQRPA